MLAVQWGAQTDVGHVRRGNEDSYLAREPAFLVADGMGGHAGGAIASGIVVAEFERLVEAGAPDSGSVAQAVARANDEILRRMDAEAGLDGMGTTLVGIVLVSDGGEPFWLGFNVGDSRLYRFIDGELTRLSVDHSVVQELLEVGEITVDQIAEHSERNVVTRALGSDPAPDVDYWLLAPHAGERFLLCSDGLTSEVPEDRIADIMSSELPPTAVATALVEAALSAGGRDNVTAVVVQTGTPDTVEAGWLSADTVERSSIPKAQPDSEGEQ